MQNLSQLQHFKLVAQEGSFARAAELANITQPALSNSIRSLERRLGFPLFERSERPIRMTPFAKIILERVEAILFEARNLDQILDNVASGSGGHLHVGMTAVFSTSLGGPIIAEWHEKHPGVKLDIDIQETKVLVDGLRDETFDLIVGDTRDLRTGVDDLQMVELPPQRGGAFCRAGHPVLQIRKPQPSDLARYRFAGTHFPESVTRAFASYLGVDHRTGDPVISIDCHNIAALRDAVAESNLILLTTSGTVRNALALGILKEIPVNLGIDGVWSVATLDGRILHPATDKLITKIVEIAQREHNHRLAPYTDRITSAP
ncbi:LysR family transcriptional regulator [Ruegeria marina]|uniref:DNA-binding transcriptional regulator, LysR family n=1 Tax=Ruegeria marina TaxID=639004 RepID=A0A1G7ECV8_9RHOB|nr:LysR family transcriptional regulator [Ruegeria marina]SDE61296.1 DNA-binding transcriptional regulator, LysR family [Ruegeria marina]